MWSLSGNVAQLHSANLHARLDLNRLLDGLQTLDARLSPETEWIRPTGQILQFQLADSNTHNHRLLDAYVRGSDLIVSFAGSGQAGALPQLCWRSLESAEISACGVELIMSVQTELLHAILTSTLSSRLAIEEAWMLHESGEWKCCWAAAQAVPECPLPSARGLLLLRLAGTGACYLEMVHPSDFYQGTVALVDKTSAVCESRIRLFPDALEKGVIRCARVRGYFLPRANDLESAQVLFQEFARSQPPLTT